MQKLFALVLLVTWFTRIEGFRQSPAMYMKKAPDPLKQNVKRVRLTSGFHLFSAVAAPTECYDRISPVSFKRQVGFSRAVGLGAGSLLALNWNAVDVAVQSGYAALRSWSFFHSFAFEPVLASTCFAIYIAFFAAIDHWVPSLWKYRIQPKGESGDSMRAWEQRLGDALRFEVPLYLGFWVPFGFIMRARKVQETTSLAIISKEVVLALLIYDGLFFAGHNLLHRIPALYHKVHRKHHRMRAVRAGDSIRHTFLDGWWDVVCAVAALMILKANALSRAVFNVIAIFFIVEAHSGMDFPFSASNIIPGGLLAGPRAHDLHHQLGDRNFQKFFTYLDRLFSSSDAGRAN